MNKFVTRGIVLSRTDFAEADRIFTFLTPDHGKVRVIAKGVRKGKSKLAGSIELFSIADLSVLVGRSDIRTLISARLVKHYANIVKELHRTSSGYELIRLTDKATEEAPEEAYFNLLKRAFEALDDLSLEPQITSLWFEMQLLKLTGHAPNLRTNSAGVKLAESKTYDFYLDKMHFVARSSRQGLYNSHQIKFLRVGFAAAGPRVLWRVKNVQELAERTRPLVQSMLKSFVRA